MTYCRARILLYSFGNAPVNKRTPTLLLENIIKELETYDVLTFGHNEGVDIKIEPYEGFEEVIKRIPKNWIPNFCLIQAPDYTIVPPDIRYAPFPIVTIPSAGDWDTDICYTKDILKHSDLVIGCGGFDRENFEKLGVNDYIIFNWANIREEDIVPEPSPSFDRPYDILYTLSWRDEATHPERSEWAIKILELSRYCKVFLADNLAYKDYLKMLRSSKLAFCYVRNGYYSGRVIEAGAQGTIPVVPGSDAHNEFSDDEVIKVDKINFFERVLQAINDHKKLDSMQKEIWNKVKMKYESKKRMSLLLLLVSEKLKNNRKQINKKKLISNINITNYKLLQRMGLTLYYCYYRFVKGGYHTTFNPITVLSLAVDKLRKSYEVYPSEINALNLAIGLDSLNNETLNPALLKEAENLLIKITQINTGNFHAYFNLGLIYYKLKKYDDALYSFQYASSIIAKSMIYLDDRIIIRADNYLLAKLVHPKVNNALFKLIIGDKRALEGVIKTYKGVLSFYIGLAHYQTGEIDLSLKFIRMANLFLPDSFLVIIWLLKVLILSSKFEEAYLIASKYIGTYGLNQEYLDDFIKSAILSRNYSFLYSKEVCHISYKKIGWLKEVLDDYEMGSDITPLLEIWRRIELSEQILQLLVLNRGKTTYKKLDGLTELLSNMSQ